MTVNYNIDKTYTLSKSVRGLPHYIKDFTCKNLTANAKQCLRLTEKDAEKLLTQAKDFFVDCELSVVSVSGIAPQNLQLNERVSRKEKVKVRKQRVLKEKPTRYKPTRPKFEHKQDFNETEGQPVIPDLKSNDALTTLCQCGICRDCLDRADDLKEKGYIFR